MGNGMCSRRQKGLLQTAFCVLVILCLGLGFYTYTHLKEEARSAEMLAQRYKQQQESVSAQLQVVYEHRSRLERSLQKERGEHKKTKEDFLVYKLEAQESLNKDKQDAMNRYGALSSQHKILKNQHDEIKKQFLDLQLQHNNLRLEHRKATETHNLRYQQLHQQKELEISSLQNNVLKLKHENKQLQKAHQDVHLQLAEAQAQVKEFKQLKEALQGMPSFKNPGLNPASLPEQNQALQEHLRGPGSSQSQVTEQKEQQPLAGLLAGGERSLTPQSNEQDRKEAPTKSQPEEPPQERRSGGKAPVWDSNHVARAQEEGASRGLRFTRTVNSLQPDSSNIKAMIDGVDQTHGVTVEQDHILLEGEPTDGKPDPFTNSELKSKSRTISRQTKVKRWDEIINDVNTDTDFKLHSQKEQLRIPFVQNTRELQTAPAQITRRHWSPGHRNANWDVDHVRGEPEEEEEEEDERWGVDHVRGEPEEEEDELTDDGLDEVDKNDAEKLLLHAMSSRSELIAQEPLIPDIDQDPAQDPNNQGEDEFEEAELERPGFAGKVAGLNAMKEQQLLIKPGPKGVGDVSKEGDEVMDEYPDDQEAENEDNGGEMDDDHEDPDLIHQDANEDDAGIPDDEGNKEENY